MVALGDLFGEGTIGQQLLVWGVLSQLFGAAINPALVDIQQAVNSVDANATLTPEQLAVAVVRQFLTQSDAQGEAAKSGIGTGRFAQLIQLAQQPVSLEYLVAGYQREVLGNGASDIAGIDFEAALADLGINPAYHPLIRSLAVQIPPVQQVMQAWLEGQIDEAEAQTRYLAAGGDPSWFQTSYNAQGQSPSPFELNEMVNRGIIGVPGTGPDQVTFDQGFLEGPWRNKWSPAIAALRFYIPPPRTVTALLKEGALTQAQALQYLADSGLDETLTAIYVSGAKTATSSARKELSEAQTVELYELKLITEAEAQTDLVALGYEASDAQLILAEADKKQAAAAAKSAVSRLQNLYLAGTNSLTVTTSALHSLGLTDDNISNLIATWNLEQSARVKELTESQVVAAWFYGGFGTNTDVSSIAAAVARLQLIGYSQANALLLMTARYHAPVTMTGVLTQ